MEPVIATNTTPDPALLDKENELFALLEQEAADMSNNRWNFAWTAMDIWAIKSEDFMEENSGKEKKALSAFIGFVHDRIADVFDARATVADSIRMGKYISRSDYDGIVEASGGIKPTFHQLRRCIFTKDGELDKVKTEAMLAFCVEKKWPTIEEIAIQRGIIDPAVKIDPAVRRWNRFVKLAQGVVQDAANTEHTAIAQMAVDLWATEQGVTLKQPAG